MKFFWRHIFPVLYGLLIYACIRLVNDTTAHEKFWERPWQLNTIEISFVIFTSYLMLWLLKRLIHHFNNKESKFINPKNILKEFGIVLAITLLIIHVIILPMVALTDDGLQLNDYVIANIIPSLFVLLYFAIVRGNQYLKIYIDQKIQIEKVYNDKLQTELKFLKAQYHPHFLFNALNTVYFQMDENVGEAKKMVEKFSELLRYQLYDQQQTVSISQEIHYLQNFIDLQKARTSDRLQLKTHFDNSLNTQQVYPLLFLPLIENAFKYVGGNYQIFVCAKATADAIEFIVENSLPIQTVPEKQNGIGLDNLKRRLELLYPGKHNFVTEKTNGHFRATLKLMIHSPMYED
ncbi:MAG TPA: histidine kinase [Chitinophagaceae bacterium]|nr:histidine kinase [Chitinophagaceae bacterium]